MERVATARQMEDTGPASLLGQRRPSGLRGTKGEVQTDGTNGRDSACADAPLESSRRRSVSWPKVFCHTHGWGARHAQL
jgi:hypothetical protein